jgi:excisionase family DNA binding protein
VHLATNTNDKRLLLTVGRTQINRFDPPLTTVRATDSAAPFPPFFHPPIELASIRPGRRLNRYRRIDFSAICCGELLQVAQTAAVLDVNPRTVYNAISDGKLPSINVGRVIKVPTRQLLDLYHLDPDLVTAKLNEHTAA